MGYWGVRDGFLRPVDEMRASYICPLWYFQRYDRDIVMTASLVSEIDQLGGAKIKLPGAQDIQDLRILY